MEIYVRSQLCVYINDWKEELGGLGIQVVHPKPEP
jgi:hypothetical protein